MLIKIENGIWVNPYSVGVVYYDSEKNCTVISCHGEEINLISRLDEVADKINAALDVSGAFSVIK